MPAAGLGGGADRGDGGVARGDGGAQVARRVERGGGCRGPGGWRCGRGASGSLRRSRSCSPPPPPRSSGGTEVDEPLRRSVDPLLAIADASADVARLAAFTAPRCEGAARADVVSAAALAESAARVAMVLVASNLAVRPGDERLERAERATADAAASAREAAEA